jgi:hypothetical protein
MAVDWTRHGRRLARITHAEFNVAFAAELADLAKAFPDRSSAGTTHDTFDLHRRHGEAVRRVIAQAIDDHKWVAADASVPRNSLLAAVFGDSVDDSSERSFLPEDANSPITSEEPLDRSIAMRRPDGVVFPLWVALIPASARSCLWVGGLGRLEGAHFSLVGKLKPQHDAATRARLDRSDHPYVPTHRLGKQGTIGQHASRCRKAITAECVRRGVPVPPGHPLVQASTHHGYRIDPDTRFVDDLTELLD